MNNKIREEIFKLADEQYKQFQSKLCPNTDNIVGVRLPLLRKLAKQIVKEDWREYMNTADNEYYEEVMLQCMVIGYVKADVEEILSYVTQLITKIDNWAICDSLCNGLKFTEKNKERVWEYLQPYLSSEKEFEMRFGVVMLLDFYIEEIYIDEVLQLLDRAKHDGYYVKMAVAWAISICYIKFPQKTMEYLKNNTLDNFTYNKALQKITESLRVDKETKILIRSMKRK
ncbi:3-methyladenine DNA glycosylase AlkD [Clostridium tetanomorphum]|uniref:DNA alkylation repair protein n=1 Tax=Clostridium tetanomorphum TaxID=1553 RepID=A0A923E7U7_CLOTT|nr:DNA alkylation repair protein [Clostridium tetanomorphum]KAJ49279.1 DNA alkylation repair enzyme [Clostridium tetanomorphum DSM 665]KAJ53931.1 DNA alkylation repair enzyme [Clostridium tetanomorphum DSM 665]MBC2398085.1 DNA alkylation repair protein [Clostridium tetanomorphum]MBP1864652.1 3-methyladenine DNA glycosylase AlkD [Clostridium tetanomorphum]NRS84122.1 3-methyladenine DNA glycosylase AlkD [Clostridium tetanomorphum]